MSLMVEFDRAGWTQDANGFALTLYVKNKPAALRFLDAMQQKRAYIAELKEYRKQRSLDANAYFWVLADKLAEVTRIPKEEIYRNAIRDIGGNTLTGCFLAKQADDIQKCWAKNGIGWVSDTLPSKIDGCVTLVLYKGSSEYDTAQMARLIDNIVQDCEAQGIETMTPDERAKLLARWEDAP